MKVFLSWSGRPSQQAATFFKDLLPCMNQDLLPFLSQHDVESGARWSLRIAEELDATDYGILFLTPINMSSPWLLFEAGALTKHLQGRACGLLLGGLAPRDVSGPLSQFQHRVFCREGLAQLFTDISKHSTSKLEDNQATRIAEKWWPDFESGFADIDFQGGSREDAHAGRDDGAVLDEILTRVRGLEHIAISKAPSTRYLMTKRGPVSKAGAMKGISELLNLLSEDQLTLLHSIAMCKAQEDDQALRDVLDAASSQDLEFLINKGILKRSKKKPIAMNILIIETLRGLDSKEEGP
ncbi:MAG: hypothetical protein O7D91_13580 [Planctomycetota bacterium]|nr:hypothetical protein [Planctomycetota bacterium]